MKTTIKLVTTSLITCLYGIDLQAQNTKNVLFIIVDDLRPEFSFLGSPAKTPHIDTLASRSTVFQRAYCNVPVSGASRASLLTGVYPNFQKRRFISAETYSQKDLPGVITLPLLFKKNGYRTLSIGKVFHQFDDRTDSWSEKPWIVSPTSGDWAYYNKWNVWKIPVEEKELHPKTHRASYCEAADLPDSCYEDNQIARKAIETLTQLKSKGEPFFLAVGFRKPHLPFIAPKKYWDLYKQEDITLADNRYRPQDLPQQVQKSGEIYQYTHTNNTSSDEFHREARHAYYACASFVDAQIGLVLNELKRLELDKNTIIVLLGDHGWHLGEHDFWGKHTLMNEATHAPLIVSLPGNKPAKTESIVEFVDIYPTLCEACDLKCPEHIQGQSFLPTLLNPQTKHREYAFIQWRKGVNIVTDRYSYAEWYNNSQQIIGQMLFDHKADPAENRNTASEKQNLPIIRQLQASLMKTLSELNKPIQTNSKNL